MRAGLFVVISSLGIAVSASQALADQGFAWPVVAEPTSSLTPSSDIVTGAVDPAPSPIITAVRQVLTETEIGPTDEDKADEAALKTFYESPQTNLFWVSDSGLNQNAHELIAEIKNAASWGLDPKAFALPKAKTTDLPLDDAQQAALEVKISKAALLYARHARGGRIMAPSKMLNSHLNRVPQLLPPEEVLKGLADAQHAADYLTSLHPQHDQFQRLRSAYLSTRARKQTRLRLKADETLQAGLRDKRVAMVRKRLGLRTPSNSENQDLYDVRMEQAVRQFQTQSGIVPADGSIDYDTARALNKRAKAPAAKLQANMEMWRWMWEDLGELHVFANIPEFMLTLKKNGETLYRERIVAGQVSKQSSIFTRTLKHIVLRPMWRVPESIKVRELWPSLKRGGGLMRQYGLKLETKDGKPVNWRGLNWHKEDIRDYEVVQPPGRNSVMGKVKFSFPSQHTIFIHDTQDKYMFRSRRRAFSHGCLRLRNPVKMAHILLREDKGWETDHVDDLIARGPNRNAVKIETRIPIHLAYFTAWVTDDGTLKTFQRSLRS